MIHALFRRWRLQPAESTSELARMLTEFALPLCSAYYVLGHENYQFLNDSVSEGATTEIVIVQGRVGADHHLQVLSTTFSWCPYEKALRKIEDAVAGKYAAGRLVIPYTLAIETPMQHGRCRLCA